MQKDTENLDAPMPPATWKKDFSMALGGMILSAAVILLSYLHGLVTSTMPWLFSFLGVWSARIILATALYTLYLCYVCWLAQKEWGFLPSANLLTELKAFRKNPHRVHLHSSGSATLSPSSQPEGDNVRARISYGTHPEDRFLTLEEQKIRKRNINRLITCAWITAPRTRQGVCYFLGGLVVILLGSLLPQDGRLSFMGNIVNVIGVPLYLVGLLKIGISGYDFL